MAQIAVLAVVNQLNVDESQIPDPAAGQVKAWFRSDGTLCVKLDDGQVFEGVPGSGSAPAGSGLPAPLAPGGVLVAVLQQSGGSKWTEIDPDAAGDPAMLVFQGGAASWVKLADVATLLGVTSGSGGTGTGTGGSGGTGTGTGGSGGTGTGTGGSGGTGTGTGGSVVVVQSALTLDAGKATLPSFTTAGNVLVAFVGGESTLNRTAPTDSTGATWEYLGTQAGPNVNAQLWWRVLGASDAGTVDFTAAGAAYPIVGLWEVSGVVTTNKPPVFAGQASGAANCNPDVSALIGPGIVLLADISYHNATSYTADPGTTVLHTVGGDGSGVIAWAAVANTQTAQASVEAGNQIDMHASVAVAFYTQS